MAQCFLVSGLHPGHRNPPANPHWDSAPDTREAASLLYEDTLSSPSRETNASSSSAHQMAITQISTSTTENKIVLNHIEESESESTALTVPSKSVRFSQSTSPNVAAGGEPKEKKKKISRVLTQEEIWDDSALIEAWDEAVEQYRVGLSFFHSANK